MKCIYYCITLIYGIEMLMKWNILEEKYLKNTLPMKKCSLYKVKNK